MVLLMINIIKMLLRVVVLSIFCSSCDISEGGCCSPGVVVV